MKKAAYPLTSTPGTRTAPAVIFWAELDERRRRYYISGKSYTYTRAADFIRQLPARSIVFFPDLRIHVGKLIPYLMEYGELSGAGDQLKSLHFIQGKQTVFLSDASLYFRDPTPELMDQLNAALYDELHVRLAPTPGNTAMRVTRRFIGDAVVWQPNELSRYASRASLFGGALHWKIGDYPTAYKYDIRSAYARAMTDIKFPQQLTTHRGIPKGSVDGFVLVANIDYETERMFSPLFVYGEDEEVYHPTAAKNIIMALNDTDLAILNDCGKLTINKIYTSYSWSGGEAILAEPMSQLEMLQRKYMQLTPAIKTTRNAVYGKFAEADEMTMLSMKLFSRDMAAGSIAEFIESDDNLFALVRETAFKPAPQHNPLFAGLITAAVRKRLYLAMDQNTIYADTDGFISTAPRELDFGDRWGDWRFEGGGHAVILGGRIYGLAGKTKIAGQHQHVTMYQLMKGLEEEISVAETIVPNPLLMEKVRTMRRTIAAIKYPHVEAVEDKLYITRSPTIRIRSQLPDII